MLCVSVSHTESLNARHFGFGFVAIRWALALSTCCLLARAVTAFAVVRAVAASSNTSSKNKRKRGTKTFFMLLSFYTKKKKPFYNLLPTHSCQFPEG